MPKESINYRDLPNSPIIYFCGKGIYSKYSPPEPPTHYVSLLLVTNYIASKRFPRFPLIPTKYSSFSK